MIVLIGILFLVAGFALRLNPLPVIAIAAAATGLAAGMTPLAILGSFGHAFNENRYVSVIYVVLPVIGLLERYGLQQRARALIASLHGATVGRLLMAYLLFRQLTAAVGLISIAGHAQTVRPLLAPMAEGAAEKQGVIEPEPRARIRALAAATDNVGVFFGEDIFLAIGSILLMKGFLEHYGILIDPLTLSWAIPSAVCAFLLHGARLMLLDRRLARGRRR
ncbi:DUF969 domain-containing protein [Sphingomonas nostoxanthinifaciens]|uniref:DUF969 domain-containing protein n=1 Tax=Sphingomonas nostoxanthinifaciens TaxID=2872652 RepID=UPI001CC2097E|nr:DUF969 family protein [Sphingomonas nostoxanthinifaciens]UAK26381.1 DUF969 domain-containing protein [Sphingomonas nostoxanthinifaciens]